MNDYAQTIIDHYPLVITLTYGKEPSIEDMMDYFDDIVQKLESQTGYYVFISYGKQTTYISKEVRYYIAQRSVEISKRFEERDLGVILVPNGFIDLLFTKTIAIFNPILKRTIIAKSFDQAIEEATRLLNEKNITMPDIAELKASLLVL